MAKKVRYVQIVVLVAMFVCGVLASAFFPGSLWVAVTFISLTALMFILASL
jgi:hypothetical protein